MAQLHLEMFVVRDNNIVKNSKHKVITQTYAHHTHTYILRKETFSKFTFSGGKALKISIPARIF